MLRFFRTRAPFFALVLLVALVATFPGIRHPLPLLGLAVFVVAAWRALAGWQARTEAARAVEDEVARAAEEWEERHEGNEEWRESLGEEWRGEEEEE